MPPAALGLPPDLQPPAAWSLACGPPMAFGGSAPRLPKQPSIANFWLQMFKRGVNLICK